MSNGNGPGPSSGVQKTSWRRTDDQHTWAAFYRWLYDEKIRIPTGFDTFDRACGGGLQPGWLISICGVESSGKSNVMLSMALEAIAAGYKVGIINLDMDWRLWFLRAISKLGDLDAAKLLEQEQYEIGHEARVERAMEKVREAPGSLILDDSMPTTITEVRHSIDHLVNEGTKLVIVDYLQLIEADRHSDSYVNNFDAVVKGVRRSALETKISLVCAAQLNRKAKDDSDPAKDGTPGTGPHVHHVLGGTALERHGDINVIIDHRLQNHGENIRAFKMRIEKNRPMGRLYDWQVKFDLRTMELSEMETAYPTGY
jgi:replicative DNA helicase